MRCSTNRRAHLKIQSQKCTVLFFDILSINIYYQNGRASANTPPEDTNSSDFALVFLVLGLEMETDVQRVLFPRDILVDVLARTIDSRLPFDPFNWSNSNLTSLPHNWLALICFWRRLLEMGAFGEFDEVGDDRRHARKTHWSQCVSRWRSQQFAHCSEALPLLL